MLFSIEWVNWHWPMRVSAQAPERKFNSMSFTTHMGACTCQAFHQGARPIKFQQR